MQDQGIGPKSGNRFSGQADAAKGGTLLPSGRRKEASRLAVMAVDDAIAARRGEPFSRMGEGQG
ncbi:hypothetical protein BHK69_12315 [Bosea vaviloviae]|uniref:Uncharacterized protein n=1 Tax=Bosea vaviloviae TaxID=1526658 RepID=A0A1D7U1A1_9HYPH|nr:hypothetical protein BHK69_12315 [Bosea vaviloviae]